MCVCVFVCLEYGFWVCMYTFVCVCAAAKTDLQSLPKTQNLNGECVHITHEMRQKSSEHDDRMWAWKIAYSNIYKRNC